MRLRRLLPLLLLGLWSEKAQAIDFTIAGVPARLQLTDSIFFGYHSLVEPYMGMGPTGDPLNPLSGLLFCAGSADPNCARRAGWNNNRLPLTSPGGAGQAYFDLFMRFNYLLSVKRYQIGMRLDTALFLNAPLPKDPARPQDGGCAIDCDSRFDVHTPRPAYLEKTFATYSGRRFEATIGDSYTVFGRGLVLSVRKVDELGIDTTILGGKVAYNGSRLKLVALAGVSNIQNVDEATGRFQSDPYDVISGARAEVTVWRRVRVGAHMAGGQGWDKSGRLGWGMTVDAPRILPWLDIYAEGAGLHLFRDDALSGLSNSGYALYASATAYAGKLTVLAEAKQYSHFETWRGTTQHTEFANIAYNLPPTLERVLTEVEDPQTEIGGARALLTYRANSTLSMVASYGFFRQGTYSNLVTHALTIHDPYAGLQVRWQTGVSHLFVNGGYRHEHDDEADHTFKTTGWFDWDFTQGLPRNLSLESQGRALFRTRDTEQWVEGNAYLALKWTPYLIAAAGLEWSTRGTTINKAIDPDTGDALSVLRYAFFPNMSLQYNVTTKTSVRLFAGGQRGGLKCVSGVCRVYPDLRGARLEVVLRF